MVEESAVACLAEQRYSVAGARRFSLPPVTVTKTPILAAVGHHFQVKAADIVEPKGLVLWLGLLGLYLGSWHGGHILEITSDAP